ncbi:MAG: hypothetical protein IJ087_15600 [Eggerthellaceae bacterium]|nr:hypothetical protein [Eggerthellaceae bacterium]
MESAEGRFVSTVIAMAIERGRSIEPIDIDTVQQPSHYAFSTLDVSDQERYLILLDALSSRGVRDYPDNDMDRLSRIRECVMADHPELFAVQSVRTETTSYGPAGQIASVTVQAEYTRTAEEAEAVLEIARQAARDCYAGFAAGSDDYAKAKRAYDYLAERVEYGRESSEAPSSDQTIEGALVNGRAVCGGYANSFAYLLQSAGVECAVVSGHADGSNHAWCLARLDGDYYYVDPTWGDPVDGPMIHDYLAITTADVEREHFATCAFSLPLCTAVADNYFVRENLLFDWPDEARLAETIASGASQVRCADWNTYVLLSDYISSGRLARQLGIAQYHYSHSDEMLTLAVYPT